jgi:hypothetical protein
MLLEEAREILSVRKTEPLKSRCEFTRFVDKPYMRGFI